MAEQRKKSAAGKRKTTAGKNRSAGTRVRKTTAKKPASKSASGSGRARSTGSVKSASPPNRFLAREITMIFLAFFFLLFFLSNFSLMGNVGSLLRAIQKGLFGAMAYAFPLLFLIGGFYFTIGGGGLRSGVKFLAVLLIFWAICGMISLLGIPNFKEYTWVRFYTDGKLGGVLGGLLAKGLSGTIGKIGTGILLFALMMAGLVIITEKSLIAFVGSNSALAVEKVKTRQERSREAERLREERDPEEYLEEGVYEEAPQAPPVVLHRPMNLGALDLARNMKNALGLSSPEEASYPTEGGGEYPPMEYQEPLEYGYGGEGPMDVEPGGSNYMNEQLAAELIEKRRNAPVEIKNIDEVRDKAKQEKKEIISPKPARFKGRLIKPYETTPGVSFEEEEALDEDTLRRANEILAKNQQESGLLGDPLESQEKSILETGSVRIMEDDGNHIPDLTNFEDEEELHIDYPFEERETASLEKTEEAFSPASLAEGPSGDFPLQREGMQGDIVIEERESKERLPLVPPASKEGAGNPEKGLERQSLAAPARPYIYPPSGLLKKSAPGAQSAGSQEYHQIAMKLQQTLHSFGVEVQITNISRGPVVTRYELHPAQGVKVSKIVALADDIKLSLAASDIRIEAPIPGKSAVGIEVPNKENQTVFLRDLLDTPQFKNGKQKLSFAVGKDIGGQPVISDIAKMPHVLIAGATGSGKSVCINTLIMSMIFKYTPEQVKLIMIDPKVVELSVYNGIPHLLIPVVTEPKKAAGALNWAVAEMMERYNKFAATGVRDIEGYNHRIDEARMRGQIEGLPGKLPKIVIIIDELADLMMVANNEVEDAIVRLAQLARAAGMHLVIATQRPSVNVITGLIKANIPSRIAFAVSSGVDSRTILDGVGAERLLGKGDMLFAPSGSSKPMRVQGAFVSDEEVQSVVEFLKNQGLEAVYDVETMSDIASAGRLMGNGFGQEERDELFEQAGSFIIEKNKASIGNLQRAFKIGFNRAARIMDQLAQAGVVSEEQGTKARQILMDKEAFRRILS